MEPRGTVLPIYFFADESMSMAPCISQLNNGLTSLLAALQQEPFAASKVRLSVIGFAEDAIAYLGAQASFVVGKRGPSGQAFWTNGEDLHLNLCRSRSR
jgi:uncharacterized protein YegL